MKLSLSTVVVDLDSGVVLGGRHGDLTDTERRLLAYLHQARGRVVARSDLLSDVWDAHPAVKSRMVDRAVARLRKKLGDDGTKLLSVYGQGYRLVADGPELEPPTIAIRDAPWTIGTPVGPCVGRSDALARLHEEALEQPVLRVCGPAGVGRFRVLRELAWRQRQRFPGGVFAVEGGADVALQLAARPESLGAPEGAGLAFLADPEAPRLVLVRDLDRLPPLPDDVDGLHVWGTTATEGHRLAPLADDDAALLLRDLRRRALPHAPWAPDDPTVAALVALAQGLPALLHVVEGLARVLPVDDVARSLEQAEPVRELVDQVLGRLGHEAREAAFLLVALGGPIAAEDLPAAHPLRDLAPELVRVGLMSPGPRWTLAPPLLAAMGAADPRPTQRAYDAVDLLVDAVLDAEAAAHVDGGRPLGLARLGAALLATRELGSAPDRTALALEAAATLLGRQHSALARLTDVSLHADGRQARGRLAGSLGRHDGALEDLAGPPCRADSAVAEHRIRMMRGDQDGAIAALEAGRDAPGSPWHHDQLRLAQARSLGYGGDWSTAMERIHDVLEACQDRGDAWTEAQALSTLGHLQAASGDARNGGANLKRAATELQRFGDRRSARLSGLVAGQLALADDDLHEAEALFATLTQEALADHHDDHARMGGVMLALTRLCRDDLEGARAALARVEVDEEHAFRRVERYVRAWLLALSGQCDQAAFGLVRALNAQRERPQAPARALAYLLLQRADHEEATRFLAQLQHDVTHGDEEHAALVGAVTGSEEGPGGGGTWARLARRWRRRAERRDWQASPWALARLVASP